MGDGVKRFLRIFWGGSGIYRHSSGPIYRPLKKGTSRTTVFFFLLVLFISAFVSARWFDTSITSGAALKAILTAKTPKFFKNTPKGPQISLNCSAPNLPQTCSATFPVTFETEYQSTQVCPDYFRWIHEDLRPWKDTGISKEMVEGAKKHAFFRLVIVNGKAYMEKYRDVPKSQSRDLYTLWGILQLMRRYPGRLPDLDLMFECADRSIIRSSDYQGPNARAPPPLFHYCGDDSTLDIVFPDWSFWGWPETNIKPWESLLEELKEGNEKTKWTKREPYAYWKGNPLMSASRRELMKCNVSDKQDWNARLYVQDWNRESQQGFKQSNLANQCIHRYKIYIEGVAWSVSKKYILACDSVTLMVKPQYYDFFTRGLQPLRHYWPVRVEDKCRSIKFAVDWGNNHKQEAQAIGEAAGKFIQEDLKMDNVYDYMFHLLNGYAKLLTYKPTVPEQAVEICLETMACPVDGLKREFLLESMVKAPADKGPCTMPPPIDHPALEAILKEKADSVTQVETWEKQYWENHNK